MKKKVFDSIYLEMKWLADEILLSSRTSTPSLIKGSKACNAYTNTITKHNEEKEELKLNKEKQGRNSLTYKY